MSGFTQSAEYQPYGTFGMGVFRRIAGTPFGEKCRHHALASAPHGFNADTNPEYNLNETDVARNGRNFTQVLAISSDVSGFVRTPGSGSAVSGRRSIMRTVRELSLISVAAGGVLLGLLLSPALAQTAAADAALDMANALDGAGGGVSSASLLSALEGAAEAGQPMALWQLGTMYENGEGVTRDPVKAFGYFSQIANQHADTPPKGVEADIVAQSFVKVGEYYRDGLPDAGINIDLNRSNALLMHAASYFGDADAQYKVGLLYLQENELGVNPLQSARWFSLAARKGHGPAQAALGEMLFNGIEGIAAQPVEGLMWMTMARKRVAGTGDESWVTDKLNQALTRSTPEEQAEAANLAEQLGTQFSGL